MIKVVTDSTSGVPPELARQHGIKVVPLRVHFGRKTYSDGVDLSSEQFYKMLKEAPELPTTSQPPSGDFAQVFAELTGAGHEVIVITISSKLSGTYMSACQARESFPEARITVIDSFTSALALEMMVMEAANASAAGKPYDEVVALVRRLIEENRTFFMVDTLEYLQKGGRIGRASAFIGTLLDVKPILTVEDGLVGAVDRVRTRNKGVGRLLSLIEQQFGSELPLSIGVLHARSPEEAHRLGELARNQFRCSKFYSGELGAVLGTHLGPGTLGLAAFVDRL
jgi:DegV family protein with EDD domain